MSSRQITENSKPIRFLREKRHVCRRTKSMISLSLANQPQFTLASLSLCFSDGYYPLGLHTPETLYNRISPSETGKSFSFLYSWYINYEGFTRYPDNFKYSILEIQVKQE